MEQLEKVPTPQFIWAVNKAVKAREAQGDRINWAPQPNSYYTCDPLVGDFSAASLKVPTMVGSVFSEFSSFQSGPDYSALSTAEREELVKARFGAEGGEKILAAFRKAFPGMKDVYKRQASPCWWRPRPALTGPSASPTWTASPTRSCA